MLKVYYQTVGIASENTYAIVNELGQALVIDPGSNASQLVQWIQENNWQPQAILLTHTHFDHIGALDEVRNAFNIEVYVHENEAEYLSNPALNLSMGMGIHQVIAQPAEHLWQPQDMKENQVGAFSFRIAFIPGHSPGHVVYIFENDGFVIAGDTLFKESIGRTDFPLGNYEQLISGIKLHLLNLPDQTIIYPGHGPSTTIKYEKRFNGFLQ